MTKFKVTFEDVIEAESEEQAYDKLLDYMGECIAYADVTAFEFEELIWEGTK